MFPARKNKNTRGQIASANAERDSLFRPTNQLEEVHSIAPSRNPKSNSQQVRSTPRASKALVAHMGDVTHRKRQVRNRGQLDEASRRFPKAFDRRVGVPAWKISDVGGGRDQKRALLALRCHRPRQLRADALRPTAGERREEIGKSSIRLVGYWRSRSRFKVETDKCAIRT